MRLIDADELLRLSHRFHISEFDRDGFEIIYADTVRNAPTVEAQKTGKWITKSDTNPYYTTWWYECSECGQYPPRDGYGQEVLSDYCPHCGCRMECEEE